MNQRLLYNILWHKPFDKCHLLHWMQYLCWEDKTHPSSAVYLAEMMLLCVICSVQKENLSLCAHSVAGFSFLAVGSVWASPRHALFLTSHAFCQMICPYLLHLITFSAVCKTVCAASQDAKDAHSFTQPYVCLSPIAPSICSGSDACPYVSACDSAWLCVYVCTWHYVYLYIFSFTEEYNTSIQEKLPLIIGSAAAGLVFLIAVVVIIIVCNRWVSPVTVFRKPLPV